MTTTTLQNSISIDSKPRVLSKKIWPGAVLGLSMLFAATLSYFVFSQQSLRLDESQSLWQSSHSPSRVLNIIAQDVHVPLYGLLLHFWQLLFGSGVEAARIFSFVFFFLTIPMVYLLGKKAYGQNAGLLAAVLISISPFLNWYGNEIRMYALFTFLTVANQYFFLEIFKGGRHGIGNNIHPTLAWFFYAATALVGMFVHYFFGLLLLVEGLFYFIYRRHFPKKTFRNLALVAGLVVLVLVPWLYYVQNLGLAGNTKPLLAVPTTINFFNTFSQFLFGFQDDHLNTLILSLWPVTVFLIFLGLAKNKRFPPESVFFLMSAFLPIIIAFAVSVFVRPVFLTRYMIFAIPSLYLFLVWFISLYPKPIRRSLNFILITAMVLTLAYQAQSRNVPVKENYREAAEYLTGATKAQDIVILSAPFTIYPVEYYYKGTAEITTLPFWNRYIRGPIPAFSENGMASQLNEIKKSHSRAYVLLSYDQGYEEQLRLYMDENFERLSHKQFSQGMNLYTYRLRYDDEIPLEDITRQ
jgi:mannosyltransferase